jgi:integrase
VAKDLLNRKTGDISKGVIVTPTLGRKTLGKALEAVINDLKMNGRWSVEHVQRQIDKHLLAYFPADRRMNTITTNDLKAYVVHRQSEGASNATCHNELASIRRAFKLALQAGELATMPHIPMPKVDNVRAGFFEREQFETVRAALPEDLRGLVTFAYLTGWRRTEVLTLSWAQVDRTAKTIRLEPGTTKNREARTIPYDSLPELVEIIDAQWEAHEQLKARDVICPYVFHRNGQQIRDFRKAWDTARTAAGCPGRIMHDFRRTAVRNFERAGVSRSAAMKVTGHKTESVYRRYAIVSENDLREAFAKLAEQRPKVEGNSGSVARFKQRTSAG